ncbi:hypothetical protein J7T55_010862 [Diaporthe amygdali]|uniref:uncharacterized protein n=1 Tax=Phomopsis amygdali TaxID=1214568 RepID=UPI0022FF108E|nr:uncharacterized protein J7T55_010862 [Diaporthe amygdali]KAJ0114472.1 hypothetical protein J7T55_010862 [Diaporthe amygdali]
MQAAELARNNFKLGVTKKAQLIQTRQMKSCRFRDNARLQRLQLSLISRILRDDTLHNTLGAGVTQLQGAVTRASCHKFMGHQAAPLFPFSVWVIFQTHILQNTWEYESFSEESIDPTTKKSTYNAMIKWSWKTKSLDIIPNLSGTQNIVIQFGGKSSTDATNLDATKSSQFQKQPVSTSMSANTHSVKAKVASDSPNEASAAPVQSDTQNPTQEKDTKALFKDAFDRAWSSTSEEILERHPAWKDMPPARGVSPATAMRVLEEMEREERKLPDGTETTGKHNAS